MNIITRIKKNDAFGIGMKFTIAFTLIFFTSVSYYYFFPKDVQEDQQQGTNPITNTAANLADWARGEPKTTQKTADAKKTGFDKWYMVTWIKETSLVKWLKNHTYAWISWVADWIFFFVYIAIVLAAIFLPIYYGYPYIKKGVFFSINKISGLWKTTNDTDV